MAQQVSTLSTNQKKKQPTKTIKVKEILQSDKIISVSVLMLKSVPESDFTFHPVIIEIVSNYNLQITIQYQI